ncbi:coiled-coil domain-containing protein 103 [Pogonomyrmex barbatus]|uniref:Coiled-coil domain-containing protein 103 n=1 Tax=Pogonomyrmex barbatus TaxID=144034 RepID=A0A6I9WEB5_9HYME|nr:coiled-coil domain-containing protein 103 [Pogonomyrmex barbatus]
MSALKTPIDYRGLEEELHAALVADELYKLQNDAKIRAIEQAVPTYEHFKQMVNGAHLKPLDRDDMKPKIGVKWNPLINIARPDSNASLKESICNKNNNENIAKRSHETCENFLQTWKTIADYSEKFTYMWNLRHSLQRYVFRIEIPASFLGDFINVCLQHLSRMDDVTSVVELLDVLSACNRFDLTVCFMTRDEQSACEQLFRQLQLKVGSSNESLERTIKSLAAKYQINLD